jgi:uncharacterized repeat protein (TIGR01451 family)
MDVSFNDVPEKGLWFGAIYLGPADGSTALMIPVMIDQGAATKTVTPEDAYPGDIVTYTITLENSPLGLSVWSLNDLLPPELEVLSVQGANYNPATNSISWYGHPGFSNLLQEGFEGAFLPAGWTSFKTGNASDPGFKQGMLGSAGSHGDAHSGDYYAWHNDDNLATAADSWLVTPQVSIPADGGMLRFWQRDYYQGNYWYHGVWVTTDADPNPATATYTELWNGDATDTWDFADVDLGAYAGQNIYIAFRYQGDWRDEWYLDDVWVYGNQNSDVHTIQVVAWVKFDAAGMTLVNTANIQTNANACTRQATLNIGYKTWFPGVNNP